MRYVIIVGAYLIASAINTEQWDFLLLVFFWAALVYALIFDWIESEQKN